jgi:hypothetical protein
MELDIAFRQPIDIERVVRYCFWHEARHSRYRRMLFWQVSGAVIPLSRTVTVDRVHGWQVAVCVAIVAYLAIAAATGTIRIYHFFLLVLIPFTFLAEEATKTFLVDWAPLMAFWLGYDRLRLFQRILFHRVAVEWPYKLEHASFSWLGGGEVPAHAWREWLAGHSGVFGSSLLLIAQLVYLSHLFVFPFLMMVLWIRSRTDSRSRDLFGRHVRAFTVLHVLAVATYILLPVAPPWWVTIHGGAMPTPQLVAQTDIRSALDGTISQGLISNASQWFAAIPSLHGAYPVLLMLLAPRRTAPVAIAGIGVYGLAMWLTTVVLNQHYFIDLFAGLVAAVLAYIIGDFINKLWSRERHPSLREVQPFK